jgi:hypothetical protein
MKELNRYRTEDEYHCIDIFLSSILQLFDRRDPSPFKEKDLDEDFSRYLVLAVRELGDGNKVKLVIKMSEHHPLYLKAKDVEEAIYNYYTFELENSRNDLSVLFRQGRSALMMGTAFLVACYAGYIFSKDEQSLFFGVLGESLHVFGWVAMWKPINLFLYEWWPIRDRIKLMQQLQKIKVEIITG